MVPGRTSCRDEEGYVRFACEDERCQGVEKGAPKGEEMDISKMGQRKREIRQKKTKEQIERKEGRKGNRNLKWATTEGARNEKKGARKAGSEGGKGDKDTKVR